MAHTGVSRADTVTTGSINPMIRQRRVDRKSSVTSMAAANRRGRCAAGQPRCRMASISCSGAVMGWRP